MKELWAFMTNGDICIVEGEPRNIRVDRDIWSDREYLEVENPVPFDVCKHEFQRLTGIKLHKHQGVKLSIKAVGDVYDFTADEKEK